MKRIWMTSTLCIVLLMIGIAASGCRMFQVNTPERQRMRMYSIRTDLDRMIDDADWALGLNRPSRLHNEGRR